MQELIEILRKWPKNFITFNDLNFTIAKSYYAIHSLLKTCIKRGYLIRLKKDFYLISSKIKDEKPDAFEIALMLYGPSYISFESALSYHGWIPEAVPIIASATSKRSKTIETELGTFSYYHIPISIFHIGVSSVKYNNTNILIADPLKALADLIYVKKRSWKNIIALSNDMRIEIENIQFSDQNLLSKLAQTYPNNRTKKSLQILLKELQA